MKARWVATLLAAALVMLAFPGPAAAAALNLIPTFGQLGDLVQARGSSFTPVGAPISVRWDGVLVASGTVTSRNFSIPFTVPLNAAPGLHEVKMCVTGSGPTGCTSQFDTADFTVILVGQTPAPTLPPPPTPIPQPSATTQPSAPPLPFPTFPLGGETPTPE
ncbi:MAG: hypothetical protein ACRDFZ_06435, partial [Candidatus Limnocylindria bacterium]